MIAEPENGFQERGREIFGNHAWKMSSCPLNGILIGYRCNFASRALQGPVKSILVQPCVSLTKRNLTHHPRKRTFSPGEHFERSESKINLVGIGPFCIPAICKS
jgi:hypothetical protein